MVRESHERTSREVEAAAAKATEQRGQVAELQRTVDQGREAYALVDSELEVRPRHPRPTTVGARRCCFKLSPDDHSVSLIGAPPCRLRGVDLVDWK